MKNTTYILILFVMAGISFPSQAQNRLIDLHVSNGKSVSSIQLRWSSLPGSSQYSVFRTDRADGEFREIAIVNGSSYDDKNCKPGIEYFYRIAPYPRNQVSDFSVVQSGYRRIDLADEYRLNTLIDQKNRDIPYIRPVDKERLEELESVYLSWIKAQMIMLVSRPYLYNNKIVILSDFNDISYDQEQNIIEFYPAEENYQLLFYGREPFELLDRTGDPDLLKRLIKNSIAFCVYQGETKIRDRSGRNKYIPKYEAVGLTTQYYKYSREWASQTILFSSNRKDIIQEVE